MMYRLLTSLEHLDSSDVRDSTFVTFVLSNADPKRTLKLHEFFYVNSEEEFEEKIELLKADPDALSEAIRL